MLFPRSSLLSCFEILLLVEAWLDSTLGTGYEGVSEVSVIFPISLWTFPVNPCYFVFLNHLPKA